jgi:EAL domain-containing protein (putative c-di-GMP-specific phosphodiesterase class I)/GGDEF domain-containing protein
MHDSRPDEAADRPVFICLDDTTLARNLASVLRDNGWRARVFTDTTVLINAAAAEPPSAIIAAPDRGRSLRQSLRDGGTLPDFIAVVADDGLRLRLEAAQAGFDACFRQPVNITALLHRLRTAESTVGAGCRVASIGNLTLALSNVLDALPESCTRRHFPPAADLLAAVAAFRPDVLIVDGDASRPAPELMVLGARQYPALVTVPLLLTTAGDKRRFDGLAARVGLEGLIGLPIAADDLAAILRARAQRARRLRTAYDYLARRDLLTGLFNREYFVEVLSQALATPGQSASITAVFHVDLEGAGPDSGEPDETAIAEAAEALRRQLPPLAIAARLQTGSFAVLVTGSDDASLQGLQQRLAAALTDAAASSRWRARLGMAVAGGTRDDPARLLEQARRRGDSEPAGPEANALKAHWRGEVQAALESNRFRLVYQPISSLSGHPGALFEVFVRLIDEHGREVLPGEFLAAAREAGLGPKLDRWVLSRALHVLANQSEASPPSLFVKLLPETLLDDGLVPWLRDRLGTERVAPERLVLEISHASLQTRREPVQQRRAELARLGCQTALEHYDDEHDSAPGDDAAGFDYLKLSHRLTENVGRDAGGTERIRRITTHARGQGVHTVASLVQDATALAALWQAGVEYIQGYFMQAPSDIFDES